MSTFYYLVCDEHRERSNTIIGRSMGERWWQDARYEHAEFVAKHRGCVILLLDEHASGMDDYAVFEGSPEEVES